MSYTIVCHKCGTRRESPTDKIEGQPVVCASCGALFIAKIQRKKVKQEVDVTKPEPPAKKNSPKPSRLSQQKPKKKKRKPQTAPQSAPQDDFWVADGADVAPAPMTAPGLPPKKRGVKTPPAKASSNNDDKTNKKITKQPSQTQNALVIGGIVVGGLLVWTGIMFALRGPGGGNTVAEAAPVEVQFERKSSEQGKFSVDVPVGWGFRTGGGSGGKPEFIRIETDDISVSIKSTLKASALGDITSGGGSLDQEELPEELEPIAKLHEILKDDVAFDMDPYEEDPPEKVMTKAGNSRLSKFVGNRGMMNGGKAYGYRATLPAGPDKAVVVCICESQKIFDQYEPVLRDVITSIGR